MASIYYRGKPPAGSWWVQLYHPLNGQMVRGSLETADPARAELLRRRIELEAELARPEFSLVKVPAGVAEDLGLTVSHPPDGHLVTAVSEIEPTNPPPTLAILETIPVPAAVTPAPPHPESASAHPGVIATPSSTSVAKAVETYLARIGLENDDHHIEGKISMLRRFFGPELFPYKRKPPEGKAIKKGYFKGTTLAEINAALVIKFLSELPITPKSKRHYRELFHHFFEVMLDLGLYTATSFHKPNPMSALPSFSQRGRRRIVFLKDAAVEKQRDVLRDFPTIRAAFEIMCEAGLRRSEALWLRKETMMQDAETFSVMNLFDPESDEDEEESTLKTDNSTRNVVILPPLRRFLDEYLPTVKGPWLIPSPKGKRWDPDNFSAALRKINQEAGLPWTARHFRCTYGTRRASEGWSVHDLAHQMGTSYQMIEKHYAAFIRPSRLLKEVIGREEKATA